MEKEWKHALGALVGIGLGATLYAGLSGTARRRAFHDALRGAMSELGVGLVEASLGRYKESGSPVWFVTLNHPTAGLLRHTMDFPADTDAYSGQTLDDLIRRLFAEFPDTGRAG